MTNPHPDQPNIGITQGLGSDYPFINPSNDIAGLIADFWLSIDMMLPDGRQLSDPAIDETPSLFLFPWTLQWVYGLGSNIGAGPPTTPTHAVDLRVISAGAQRVFDSTTGSYTTKLFGALHVHEWTTTNGTCRLVARSNLPNNNGPWTFDQNIYPTNGVLDDRAVEIRPRRIRSITANGVPVTQADLQLVGGYNATLAAATTTVGNLVGTKITVGLAPGSGLGVFDDCTSNPPYIVKINDTPPDKNGNFTIGGKACVDVSQAVSVLSTSPLRVAPAAQVGPTNPMLTVSDHCSACCACSGYVAAANKLKHVYSLYAAMAADLNTARVTHLQNVARWDAGKACRQKNTLSISLQPQSCPFIDVVAQYVNQTDKCQYKIDLRIRGTASPTISSDCSPSGGETTSDVLSAPASIPRVQDNSIIVWRGSTSQRLSIPRKIVRYTLEGTWCDYRAYWDAVAPFDTVYVKFRLRLPYGGLTGTTPYALTLWLDGQVGHQWIVDSSGHKLLVSDSAATLCGTPGT